LERYIVVKELAESVLRGGVVLAGMEKLKYDGFKECETVG